MEPAASLAFLSYQSNDFWFSSLVAGKKTAGSQRGHQQVPLHCLLLVAQGFDGIHLCGSNGWKQAKYDAYND